MVGQTTFAKQAEQKARLAESLYKDENFPVEQIARELHISKTTLYKYLRHRGVSVECKHSPRLIVGDYPFANTNLLLDRVRSRLRVRYLSRGFAILDYAVLRPNHHPG